MVEQHIGLTDSDASEQGTDGENVTGKHLFAEGGDGHEREATLRSETAGASSDAPANSGIPSAVKQHKVQNEAFSDADETPMGGRIQPVTQNVEP